MRSQPGIFESGRPPSEPFSFLKRATRFSISLREMPRRGRVSWKFKDAPTSESLEIVDDSLGYSLLAFGKSIDGPREIRHERIEVAEAVLRRAWNEYGIFELRLIAPREGLPVEVLLEVISHHACKSQLAAIVFPEEFRRLLLLYRAGYRPAYQPAERGQARKGANHEALGLGHAQEVDRFDRPGLRLVQGDILYR